MQFSKLISRDRFGRLSFAMGKIAVDEPIYLRRFSVGECLGHPRASGLAASARWAESMATPSRFRITVPLTYGFRALQLSIKEPKVIGMAVDHLVGLGPSRQSEEIIGIATGSEILNGYLQRNKPANSSWEQSAILPPEEVASRLSAATMIVRCSR